MTWKWFYKNDSENIESYCLTFITVYCYLCYLSYFCCCHRCLSSNKVVGHRNPYYVCAFHMYSQTRLINISGSCKGVMVWLNSILHIQADLALPFAHSHIAIALNWPIINFPNFERALFYITNFLKCIYFIYTHFFSL